MSELPDDEAAFAAAQAAVQMPPSVPNGMRLELARARIKPGKSARVDGDAQQTL